MKLQKSKGARDMSIKDMTAFRFVEGTFRDSCLKWGYGEIRTPTIENLYLFTSAGTLTPESLNRVYSFLDWDGWSGERVVLRPDGTIPVARMYIESGKKDLARLFYVTNIFAFESSGKENRERWQCGCELIGAASSLADTELISLSLEVLKRTIPHDIEVSLSHAGLVKALLAKLGISPDEQAQAFDQLMDGKTDLPVPAAHRPEAADTLLSLLTLKGQSSGFVKNLKALIGAQLPEIMPHLDDFIGLITSLEEIGIKCRIDIPSGGGFEYYTGAMFQLFAGGEKVGGGGRYDMLIPSMGGGNISASGFALYLDRIMNMIKPDSVITSESVLVVNHDKDQKRAYETATELRQAGYNATIQLDNEKNCTWTLDIQSNGQYFLEGKGLKAEAGTMAEVMKCLGGQFGH